MNELLLKLAPLSFEILQILKMSSKTNGAKFHHRITQVAPSNSYSKDNVNSKPQTQKKGRPSSLIQATGIEL